MMKLSYDVISALKGYTLATAESCTGGGVGAALTLVPGSSSVYKGGIISYTNNVKIAQLGVDASDLDNFGAVSEIVAAQMAIGARVRLCADFAISVTGLAGPDGDEYGNPVGTVFIGFSDRDKSIVAKYHFIGDRQRIREQAICAALEFLLSNI